ncbi:hypothetical protein [Roseomonas sp. CECT 9278]|uniref:hypothetical protein n=1 Tax=Roseomonas sp. CECT 9278 TaxID=2845823 RepID=UPI001E366777|nr:hypothetical protein [Roseomonas sp. CECT 9278]
MQGDDGDAGSRRALPRSVDTIIGPTLFSAVRRITRSASIAFTALACIGATLARADEACLYAPTPVCIVDVHAAGADLPLHAVRPATDATFAVTRVMSALLALDEVDIAEAVARRAPVRAGGQGAPDLASPIAVARFMASVRAGTPAFSWLDGLADPDGPLAALYGSSTTLFGAAGRAAYAYRRAGDGLLAALAEQQGVATAEAVSREARSAFRASAAWQGVDAGMARWNERVARHIRVWENLAEFRTTLDDPAGARDALARIGTAPATGTEIRLWWRLGDAGRAEARARESGEGSVMAVHADLAIAAALAAGDRTEALRLIAEAWPRSLERRRYGSADMHHVRRLIRATAAAGARADALVRAEALRSLVRSVPPRENETYWIEAGAALNDIGEYRAALALLHEELAWRSDSRPSICAPRSDRPAPIVRRGVSDPYALAVEFARAGAEDAALCVLGTLAAPFVVAPDADQARSAAAFLQGLGLPSGAALRLARRDIASREVHWMMASRPGDVPHWRNAVLDERGNVQRIEAILTFLSRQPAPVRMGPLLTAAQEGARGGLGAWAATRLHDALALLPDLGRPFPEACRIMSTARSPGREDLAEAAFRSAVDAARAEPDFVRGAILVDIAACRAGRRAS